MRLVCLANSFKEGGRCLAGIELNEDNTCVMQNGRPKWIRPVCDTEHQEVPTDLIEHIRLLDIIELTPTENVGRGYQKENVHFDESSLRVVGTLEIQSLANMTDNGHFITIFGNEGKAVPEATIENLSHSLVLISTENFNAFYEPKNGKQKARLTFRFADSTYNLPITDPVFIHQFRTNQHLLRGIGSIYLTLSLARIQNGWYSKLIAGIIY